MNFKFRIREDILYVYKPESNSIFLLPINILHDHFFKLSFIKKMDNVSFINGNEIKLDSNEKIDFSEFYKELDTSLINVNSIDHKIDTEIVLFAGTYIKLEIIMIDVLDVAAQAWSEGLPCSFQGGPPVCAEGVMWNCYGPPPGDLNGDGGSC